MKNRIIALLVLMMSIVGYDMVAGCKGGRCAIKRPVAKARTSSSPKGTRRQAPVASVRRTLVKVKPVVASETVEVKAVAMSPEAEKSQSSEATVSEEPTTKVTSLSIKARVVAAWHRIKQLWS